MRIHDEGRTERIGAHHRSPESISVSMPWIAATADGTALQRVAKDRRRTVVEMQNAKGPRHIELCRRVPIHF